MNRSKQNWFTHTTVAARLDSITHQLKRRIRLELSQNWETLVSLSLGTFFSLTPLHFTNILPCWHSTALFCWVTGAALCSLLSPGCTWEMFDFERCSIQRTPRLCMRKTQQILVYKTTWLKSGDRVQILPMQVFFECQNLVQKHARIFMQT